MADPRDRIAMSMLGDPGAFRQSEKDLRPYRDTASFSELPSHHYSGFNGALMPTDAANQQGASRSILDMPGRAWNAFKNLAPYESPNGDYRPGTFQHQVLPGLAHSAVNGLTSAANAFSGQLPQYELDQHGNTRTSQDMGQAALDAAGLAATGGVAAPKPTQQVAARAFSNSSESSVPGLVVANSNRNAVAGAAEKVYPKFEDINPASPNRISQANGSVRPVTEQFGNIDFGRSDSGLTVATKPSPAGDFRVMGNGTEAGRYNRTDGFATRQDALENVIGKHYGQIGNDSFTSPFRPGQTLYSNSSESSVPGIAMGLAGRQNSVSDLNSLLAKPQGRQLDNLGYYSKLDEVLQQFKPTDTVTSQTLAQRGVKQSELQARGLGDAFSGGGVKVGDLRSRVSEPVGLNEKVYDRSPPNARELSNMRRNNGTPDDILAAELGIGSNPLEPLDRTKFPRYSLDGGSNPTYRETVLHLPTGDAKAGRSGFEAAHPGKSWDALSDADRTYMARKYGPPEFRGGHWQEPNVIAHMRTSMQKDAAGRPVYHLDELQSDWGQKLRDGGVRDEAKIGGLRSELSGLEEKVRQDFKPHEGTYEALMKEANAVIADRGRFQNLAEAARSANLSPELRKRISDHRLMRHQFDGSPDMQRINLLRSEIRTAEAAAPGHPLVNTTDQWSGTALRRALRQAVDAGAEGFAIPSGKTVQGYGMHGGAETAAKGMDYAYDKMYPSAFGKEIAKLDPSIQRQIMELQGHPGKQTSYWPITDKVREEVRRGLPLFSNDSRASAPGIALAGQGEGKGIGLPQTGNAGGKRSVSLGPLKKGEFEPVDFKPWQGYAMYGLESARIAKDMAQNLWRDVRGGEPLKDSAPYWYDRAKQQKQMLTDELHEGLPIARAGGSQPFHYPMLDADGKQFGYASGQVIGDRMHFDWLGNRDHEGVNSLGVRGVKALREQVRQDFPEVKHFSGMRISGARDAWDAPNKNQSVYIKSNDSRAFAPGIALAGQGEGKGMTSVDAFNRTLSEPKGIRAYHGSPHDFDKFSLDAIGSGEGAQAFGHGLYFAENESVAKSYRDNLGRPVKADGGGPIDITNAADTAGDLVAQYGSAAEAIKQARYLKLKASSRRDNQWLSQEQNDKLRALAVQRAQPYDDVIRHIESGTHTPIQRGHMYEVNIKADPEHFLDWDKPLSAQSEKVRGAWDTLKTARPEYSDPSKVGGQYRDPTGRQLYSALFEHVPGMGEQARAAVTEQLKAKGIPGISYLDQGSRAAGQGSKNHVVFDPELIEILRKYANHPNAAIPGTALASGQQSLTPEEQQAILRRFRR